MYQNLRRTRIKGATFISYHISSDYKVGVVNIAGIKLSETVFDYLENKGILSKYTYIRNEEI